MARGRLALSFGALLLFCLTQTASGLPRRPSTELSSSGPDAYILSQGENSFSTNLSLEALGAARARLSGDFMWIRRGGKIYQIRDAKTLREAQALFAPLRQLDPEHEALARRQSLLNEEQEALDREQEKIEQELDRLTEEEKNPERAAARQANERRRRDLEAKVRALESKERELDQIERSIDAREDALEKRAEEKLWRLIDESITRGIARPDETP